MVYCKIACSTVLLNDKGDVKIAMQECCEVFSNNKKHLDVQATADIMIQLMEKRTRDQSLINTDDLRRWSFTAKDFFQKITSASAEILLQVSLSLFYMGTILTSTA
jgi:hypothetical protein